MKSEEEVFDIGESAEDEDIAVTDEAEPVADTRSLLSALIRSSILTLAFIAVTWLSYLIWAFSSGMRAEDIFSGGSSPAHVRAISRAVILLICAAICKKRGTFGRELYGGGRAIPAALVCGCALQIFAGFLLNPAAFSGEAAIGARFDFGDISAWSSLAVSAILSPVTEEIVFRGLIYGELRRSSERSWLVAAVISSLLFAVVHSPAPMMAVAFAAGIIFAYTVERTGSVAPAVAAHCAFNVLSYFSGYLPLGNAYIRIAVFALSAVFLALSVILIARREGYKGK